MNLCASSLALFEGTGEMLLNLSKLEDQQKKYKAPNWLALRKLKSFLMKMQAQIKKKLVILDFVPLGCEVMSHDNPIQTFGRNVLTSSQIPVSYV